MSGVHAITTAPFIGVHLTQGLGNFNQDAVPGSGMWAIACPLGVTPCLAPGGIQGPDWYLPIQSGEYTVTYTKGLSDGSTASASFPLIVGTRGMRIELTWEHTTADNGVDLDLHVHQPNNALPWGFGPAVPQDCASSNCALNDFSPQALDAPKWFADSPAKPPTPVNWSFDTTPQGNNCYYDPRGEGAKWAMLNQGCHNPRLDLDNIICNFASTDPNDATFCVPENTNIDYPPVGQWTRVGVHYYNNHGHTYVVHPTVRIFCDGALAGLLGPSGYYSPEAPITFAAADGTGAGSGNRFWVAADAAYAKGLYRPYCTVLPAYADASKRTPFFLIDSAAATSFAPSYPPSP
jgi:hypothetical protein